MKGPEGVDDILAQLNGMGLPQDSLVSDMEEVPENDIREVRTKQRRAPRGKTQQKKGNNVIDLDM
jgi:hypothetical protein